MRIAIVHDWLATYAGSERVLEQMLLCLPDADLFSVVDFMGAERAFLQNKSVKTSFIQNLPFARGGFRNYLLLMPLAIEQFDLSNYDVVISNSHAVAKGVLTGPDQIHISYVHSPMRYAWELQHQYLTESGLGRGVRSWVARWVLHKLRLWDFRTSNGVDTFIANSMFTARRVRKTYRRESEVIYPPVDVGGFQFHSAKEDYYLVVSRIVPYKRIDIIVEAFARMPEKRLVVLGDGPGLKRLKSIATHNVELLGFKSREVVRHYMERAKAFIVMAEEDFGIAPVEAQACGVPVIAYSRGGAVETIRGLEYKEPTGVFFDEQSSESLITAVMMFENVGQRMSPLACRENAERFREERFRSEFSEFVRQTCLTFQEERRMVQGFTQNKMPRKKRECG